ncbi:MAG: hypothetical protein ACREF8_04610, partial [Chthoniobacterales bacterium]
VLSHLFLSFSCGFVFSSLIGFVVFLLKILLAAKPASPPPEVTPAPTSAMVATQTGQIAITSLPSS